MNDLLHQDYYNKGIECIDYIMSHNMTFSQGNVIKYITRYKLKGDPLKDLLKAKDYLEYLITQQKEENGRTTK